MKEILNSIKAYLYDRSASPLTGAFIVAWSIWNYRVFIAVFAGKERTVEAIFLQIDKSFMSFTVPISDISVPVNGAIYHGLIIPAIMTMLYVYIYPFLAKPVFEYSLRRQRELREIKQQEESNRLLSVEESREIYRRLSELQVNHSNDVDSYNNQISSLNQIIKELEKELSAVGLQADKLPETPFEDIDNADPDEFYSEIEKNIESIPDGEFHLSDLYTTDQWGGLNSSLKQNIGKSFKAKVERGDFVGVSASRKGLGNKQIYFKKSTELSSTEEGILQNFSGLNSGHGLAELDVKKNANEHIELIRVLIHDLFEGDYISMIGKNNNDEKLYNLSLKGRKYLIKNDLLPDEEQV